LSKLDAQNKAFKAVLVEYYETGSVSPEFLKCIDDISRYTSSLPQFRGYSTLYLEGMNDKARERAIDALLKKKFDITKNNPVSFFGNLWYNTFLNYLRDNKKKHQKENPNQAEPPRSEREPLPRDPVALFAPFISWILADKRVAERFLVFASIHYPELIPHDAKLSATLQADYIETFPSAKKPKARNQNVSELMTQIIQLRKAINRQNDMRNEGLRNNMEGLKNIIEKRVKAENQRQGLN
jgi:hypothetical protein